MPISTVLWGTLIFHLLLAIFFLSMGIAGLRLPEGTEIELAAPPEQVQKKIEEEKLRKEEIRKKVSREEVQKMLQSIAVNENADKRPGQKADAQKYIDEVMKELEREKSSSGRYKPQRISTIRRTVCGTCGTGKRLCWIR